MSVKLVYRQLQSQPTALLCAIAALIASFVLNIDQSHNCWFQGLWFRFNVDQSIHGHLGADVLWWFVLNTLCLVGAVSTFMFINNAFRLVKSTTLYYIGLTFIVLSSVPFLLYNFQPSSVVALSVSLATALLFFTLSRPKATLAVYTLFLLLSCTSLCVQAAIYLLPAFYIGLVQMRCLNIKTMAASLLGLITPYWIVWGFGIAHASTPQFPLFEYSIFDTLLQLPVPLAVGCACNIAAGVAMLIASAVKALAHNAPRRARLGFLDILQINILVLFFIDASNLLVYLPLFTVVWSFMGAHAFTTKPTRNVVATMIALPVIFIAISIWNYL